MKKEIINTMIEDTLEMIIGKKNLATDVYIKHQDQLKLYAMEYLLLSTFSNRVVSIVFKLNDIDELENIDEQILEQELSEFTKINCFKEYLIQCVMNDFNVEPDDFLGWANMENEYSQESPSNDFEPILTTDKLSDIPGILNSIAATSLTKEKPYDEHGKIDLKQLIANMLKEVADLEQDYTSLKAEYDEELFIDVVELEEDRINKDDANDITDHVLIEEVTSNGESVTIDSEQVVENYSDLLSTSKKQKIGNKLQEVVEAFQEYEGDLNGHLHEEESFYEVESDMIDDILDEDIDLTVDDNLFEDQAVDTASETNFVLENQEPYDTDSGHLAVEDKQLEQQVVAEISSAEYADEVDQYLMSDNIESTELKFVQKAEDELYYKIKNDDELQAILQVRKIKNILLFLTMFTCLAAILLFIILI